MVMTIFNFIKWWWSKRTEDAKFLMIFFPLLRRLSLDNNYGLDDTRYKKNY